MKLPVVNEQDEVIGYKNRGETNPEDITRVSALWVIDKDNNILLARRALTKKHGAGLWGPAVAGTVEEGESYEQNIIKEAEEEIGLVGVNFSLGPKKRVSSSHEYFCQWFTAIVDRGYPFKKQDDEVEEVKWFSKSELERLVKEKDKNFTPSFKEYSGYF